MPFASPTDNSASLLSVDVFAFSFFQAAYFAFNYAMFGRTAQALTRQHDLSNKDLNLTLIPARLMSNIFVTSDVVTFLIQAGESKKVWERKRAKNGWIRGEKACLSSEL